MTCRIITLLLYIDTRLTWTEFHMPDSVTLDPLYWDPAPRDKFHERFRNVHAESWEGVKLYISLFLSFEIGFFILTLCHQFFTTQNMGLTRILFEKHTDKGWTIAGLNSFSEKYYSIYSTESFIWMFSLMTLIFINLNLHLVISILILNCLWLLW